MNSRSMKARGLSKLLHKNSNDGLLSLYHTSSFPDNSPNSKSPTAAAAAAAAAKATTTDSPNKDKKWKWAHNLGLHKLRKRRLVSRILAAVVLLPTFLVAYMFWGSGSSTSTATERSLSTSTTSKDKESWSFTPNNPDLELELFLNPSRSTSGSPGAIFIQYLQEHLYYSQTGALQHEARRLKGCHSYALQPWQLVNSPLCFAGEKSYQATIDNLQRDARNNGINPVAVITNTPLLEQHTPVLFPAKESSKTTSVYAIRRYGNFTSSEKSIQKLTTTVPQRIPANISEQFIPNLGTPVACLPLVLAGAAVAAPALYTQSDSNPHPLMVELGPYFGLASKCIVSGVRMGQIQPKQYPKLQPRNPNDYYNTRYNHQNMVSSKLNQLFQSIQVFNIFEWLLSHDNNAQDSHPSTLLPPKQPLLYSYDTFDGDTNLRSLQNRPNTQWILDVFFPHFGNDTRSLTTAQRPRQLPKQNWQAALQPPDTNFQFLWERAVWPIYAKAHAVAGRMDKTQLHTVYERALLDEGVAPWSLSSLSSQKDDSIALSSLSSSLGLLVLDSAKSAQAWNQQWMGVLGRDARMSPGTIVFLMDFEYVAIQVKQVYGCLRHQLLPVYISWNMEHWAFVVTGDKPISLVEQKQCYVRIAKQANGTTTGSTGGNKNAKWLDDMVDQLKADLKFVSQGLQSKMTPTIPNEKNNNNNQDNNDQDALQEVRKELETKMIHNLRDHPEQWAALAKL